MRRTHPYRRLLIAEIRLANICLVLLALIAAILALLGPFTAAAAKVPPPGLDAWFTLVIGGPTVIFLTFTTVNLMIFLVRLAKQHLEQTSHE